MNMIDRRSFLRDSAAGLTAASLAGSLLAAERAAQLDEPGVIDTNVNLFEWPFRALKYRKTDALVAKLKKHRVIEAWAGSFEALFAKDLSGVNARLAGECRKHARYLIPFGSVNLAWPDWEEDLRRCHEEHRMPGVRIYPGYQPFNLDHPGMAKLVRLTAKRGLILQIVFGMEDPRVHHPIIDVGPVTLRPLVKVVQASPGAKVQLLHFPGSPAGDDLAQLMAQPNTFLEISRLEGNGAIGRMIGSIEGLPSAHVPVDRLTFGSHAPYFPVETALLKLIESPLEERELHAIRLGNARRLVPRS